MNAKNQLLFSAALADLNLAGNYMIEETKSIVAAQDHVALIKHLVDVRQVEKMVKEAYSVVEKLQDRLSHELVPDEFRRISLKTINIEGVGRVTVSYRWACSILDGMKPEALDWLRNGGNGGLIIETVNSGTLAAFAKSEVEEKGKELPTEIFKTSLNPFTSITKV